MEPELRASLRQHRSGSARYSSPPSLWRNGTTWSKAIHFQPGPSVGAVLIVSLLLLLVLTVLGVVMMQTTRMQERMAGATRDLNMSLQGAESGLRYGESVVAAYRAA